MGTMSSYIENTPEDELVEAVAEALNGLGLVASSQDTGGGISCVVLQHKNGGEIAWGTADINWGAAITDADGEYISSIESSYSSDLQDAAAIAKVLFGPSLENGAVRSTK